MGIRDNATAEERRKAFRLALVTGREIRVEECLGGLEPGPAAELLGQLLADEVGFRRGRGEDPERAEYADRFRDHSEAVRRAFEDTNESLHVTWSQALVEESGIPSDVASMPTQSLTGVPHESDSADSTTRVLLDRYELLEVVGRGGFGEVWRARDRKLQQIVAVKLPRADRPGGARQLTDLLEEARRSTRLTHPGVVRVLDVCHDGDTCFIVSEFKDGGTLRRRMEAGPIDVVEIASIVAELAEILHEAHLQDCVHRDVKPENVLLDRRGRPFLVDFGLAVSEREMLHEREGRLGTVAYMSPEQASGRSNKVDARADLYSLGVLTYRMLTGRLPYVATTPEEYVEQVVGREPRPLRTIDDTIPVELERICLKCLRKDPADRYSTGTDLAADLRMWLTEVASTSDRPAWHVPREPARPTPSGSLIVAIVSVVVALAAVVAIALRLLDRPAVESPAEIPPAAPRDFSEIPADEIEVERPYPLMSVEPRRIVGNAGYHNTRTESYHVPNGLPRLVSIGEVDRRSYTVSLQVVREGSGSSWGEFGFVFGLHPDGEGGMSGQAIVMVANKGERADEFPLIAHRRRIVVDEGNVDWQFPDDVDYWQNVPRKRTVREVAVPHRFELTVLNGTVSAVRWDGHDLGHLHTPELDGEFPAEDHRGKFGLWTAKGGAKTFRGGSIIVESEK